MSERLEEERKVYLEALKKVDDHDGLAITLGSYPGMLRERIEELEEENQRYKQALEFYANKENHKVHITDDRFELFVPVKDDGGELARQASKGESK